MSLNINYVINLLIISSGAVYDITTYVDYHPGGAEELMRGAGIDSTDLFNEVHKWVNFQNMLKEFLVGYLVQPPKTTMLKAPGQTSLTVPGSSSQTSLTVPHKKPIVTGPLLPPAPKFSYDSYQTERCFTLIVYGKIAMSNKIRRSFFYGIISKKAIRVFIHCLDRQFLLDLQLFAKFQKFEIRNSNLKFELVIHKQQEKLWPSEGTHLSNSKTTYSEKFNNLESFVVRCTENVFVTHDSRLLTFKFLKDFYAIPPLGSHVFVQNPDTNSLIDKKPYTVYDVIDQSTFQLLVKQYADGVMSTYMCSLQSNQTVKMQGFDHFIDLNVLHKNNNIVVLAAGTGITPFYRIMKELSANKLFKDHTCSLMFYNKTQEDILVKDQLKELQDKIVKLDINHILSQESWSGLTGRIELLHLKRFSSKSLFLICGPKLFMEKAVAVLLEKGVSKSNMIEFNG